MGYIGTEPTTGDYIKLDAISISGSGTTFNLLKDSAAFFPGSAEQMIVSVNGVTQAPTIAYNISGSQITFTQTLTTNDVIDYIVVMGQSLAIGTPSDGTVTNVKIANSTIDLAAKVTGILPLANGGTGSSSGPALGVLQLKHTTSSSSTTIAESAGYGNTGVGSITITPASTQNKLLVMYNQSVSKVTEGIGTVDITRNGTYLNGGTYGLGYSRYEARMSIISGTILDNPATTSAVTYQLKANRLN